MTEQSLATVSPGGQVGEPPPLLPAVILDRKRTIMRVMHEVLKKDIHYGTIPGTAKPTIYKAGAECILSTFHLGARPVSVEEVGRGGHYRYRIAVEAFSQSTGQPLGSCMGEAGTDEEKYAWRGVICNDEWDEAPESDRRIKYKKVGWNKAKGEPIIERIKQVRTNPADVANTVLKMAFKRGFNAVTLQVTGASDIFGQDLDDLPDGFNPVDEPPPAAYPATPPVETPNAGGDAQTPAPNETPATEPSRPKYDASGDTRPISEAQENRFWAIAKKYRWNGSQVEALISSCGYEKAAEIRRQDYEAIVNTLLEGPKE